MTKEEVGTFNKKIMRSKSVFHIPVKQLVADKL